MATFVYLSDQPPSSLPTVVHIQTFRSISAAIFLTNSSNFFCSTGFVCVYAFVIIVTFICRHFGCIGSMDFVYYKLM